MREAKLKTNYWLSDSRLSFPSLAWLPYSEGLHFHRHHHRHHHHHHVYHRHHYWQVSIVGSGDPFLKAGVDPNLPCSEDPLATPAWGCCYFCCCYFFLAQKILCHRTYDNFNLGWFRCTEKIIQLHLYIPRRSHFKSNIYWDAWNPGPENS